MSRRKAGKKLTVARLREVLSYDPITGLFRWRVTMGGGMPGCIAGYEHESGYILISIDWKMHRAHRLAWLYTHGEPPAGQIDHINWTRSDNRIANLRDVSHQANQHHRSRANRNSASGLLGVTLSHGRWRAQIKIAGRHKALGVFDTPEKAHAAYLKAKRELHTASQVTR